MFYAICCGGFAVMRAWQGRPHVFHDVWKSGLAVVIGTAIGKLITGDKVLGTRKKVADR